MKTISPLILLLFSLFLGIAHAAQPDSLGVRARAPQTVRDTSEQLDDLRTNAARLARGLPVLTPNRLYSPTRVRRDTPSAVPGGTYTGKIAIYAGISKMGYLQRSDGYWDSGSASASTFQYTQPQVPSTPTELLVTGGPTRIAGAYFNAATLGPNKTGYVGFAGTTTIKMAGQPATNDPNASGSYKWTETAIFFVDPVTRVISMQWVNQDTTMVPAYFQVGGAWLYATGDTVKGKPNSGAYDVTLKFEIS